MSNFEFDTAYSAITGAHVPNTYIPFAEHDKEFDILLDGFAIAPGWNNGWDIITGYTRQHGYRGAIFHPSENATDDQIREWVREAGGDVFAIVEVSGHDDESPVFPDEPDYCTEHGCAHESAGWAIIYREAA